MHPIVVANVLELQAIRLLLFGIAEREVIPASRVRDIYKNLECELIRESKKEEDNDDNKSSEGGV